MAKKEKTLKITLVKSTIGALQSHKATIEALGLRKIGQCVEQKDNPQTRGMVAKVSHLVSVEE
ncbi:MAG: 50S ribosomal protein L30 [Clostridia bacterium]